FRPHSAATPERYALSLHDALPIYVGSDGRWRTPEELAAHFTELGVTAATPVGAYCGSGVTASSIVLALEVVGRDEPAALYAGSWSHWCRDPQRPVATGEQPG